MNAQQLAALGEITRKAIADAVAPLKALCDEQAQRIAALNGQLQQLKNYDDSEIKAAVHALRESVPAAYDDSAVKSAFSEQGKRVAAVVDSVQAIKDRIEAVASSVPAPYDDTALKQLVAEAESRLTAKQARESEALLGRISDVAKSVPTAYDDTALRNDLSALIKQQDEQIQMVAKMASERPTPADGRDALQLEVLPAIDEAKSYTRGTYAKHAGGLWRAFEQTSGMRGWECIVEGVKELQVDMVDKRLSVKAVMSSGAFAEMVKELPIQIYRGVFKSDDPYHQGDTVTWAGSLWHCNVTGTKALPGDGSSDWTLAVKKGRDGREVVKTERTQGPVKIGGAE